MSNLVLEVTQITNYTLYQNSTSNWGNDGFDFYNATLSPNLTTFTTTHLDDNVAVSLIPSFKERAGQDSYLLNFHNNSYPFVI